MRPFLVIIFILAFATVSYAQTVDIPINPMIDLNLKTKKEIYEIRKGYVSSYPELFGKKYIPSEEIFGQILDNRPWWGILGLSYYGPGKQSINGESEESRFIINPFLLIGLSEVYAYIEDNRSLKPIPIYPEPISLAWDKKRSQATVKYDVTSFWQKKKKYYTPTDYEHGFELIAYNARDFGFNYFYIVPEKSNNIIPSIATKQPVEIKQFIHCGASCGYPGGCNNMSPSQPEVLIKLNDVPAYLYFKLWRNKPTDVSQPADMVFVIEMI